MMENGYMKSLRAMWLVVALLTGLAGYALVTAASARAAGNAGEAAPDVTLHSPGGDFRLSEHKGKVLILFFTFPG
jgi:cytochrome oxidase Cu insertion factor (SCO1/SenC/PrrC family)